MYGAYNWYRPYKLNGKCSFKGNCQIFLSTKWNAHFIAQYKLERHNKWSRKGWRFISLMSKVSQNWKIVRLMHCPLRAIISLCYISHRPKYLYDVQFIKLVQSHWVNENIYETKLYYLYGVAVAVITKICVRCGMLMNRILEMYGTFQHKTIFHIFS